MEIGESHDFQMICGSGVGYGGLMEGRRIWRRGRKRVCLTPLRRGYKIKYIYRIVKYIRLARMEIQKVYCQYYYLWHFGRGNEGGRGGKERGENGRGGEGRKIDSWTWISALENCWRYKNESGREGFIAILVDSALVTDIFIIVLQYKYFGQWLSNLH